MRPVDVERRWRAAMVMMAVDGCGGGFGRVFGQLVQEEWAREGVQEVERAVASPGRALMIT